MDALEINRVPITCDTAQQLIAELDRELGLSYAPEHRFTVDLHRFEKDGGIFLIGKMAEQAVACGAIRPIDRVSTELKRMFVVEAYRGRGFAKQMLMELERMAMQSGYQRILLETGDDQHAAMHVYRNAGYQQNQPFGQYTASPRSVCFGKSLHG